MGHERNTTRRVAVEFEQDVWADEVERLSPRSVARAQAEKARRKIEDSSSELAWAPCKRDGPRGTRLPLCVKLYVPLAAEGVSAAPFGFVFRLTETSRGLILRFAAFGERHPANSRTRSVYERAHRRLHGRYP